MRRRNVIRAYQAYEWSEIALLGVITIALVTMIESAFLTSSYLASLTAATPFVAAALAWKRYEFEHVANRTSASFVAALFALGAQVTIALIVTSL